MKQQPQLVVLGAGPAGIQAAITASRNGVDTLLIDQAPKAGGQIYRALPASYSAGADLRHDKDFATGEKLRQELADSPARTAFGHTVWRVSAGFEVETVSADGPKVWRPQAVIAATGAYERCVPFKGWTQPGVIGLAAATILLKSQQALPGHRVVVAGCGPLLPAVAASILKGGGNVAAVIDLASRSEWFAALPSLALRPELLLRGFKWTAAIRSAGVPVLNRHTIVEAIGNDDGLSLVVAKPTNADGTVIAGASPVQFEADCLAIGHGLVPSTDVTRALRARHIYQPDRGGWITDCDDSYRTSVSRLYVCGDGAGIRGAVPAALQGQIAGLAAARDLENNDKDAFDARTAPLRAKLPRVDSFGAAMTRLMALRPAMMDAIAADTIVCRCEDVTRSEIDDALDVGAADLNQLKAWTRAGMGPCQGRVCGETISSFCAERMGGRERVGLWTGRSPLRPVSMKEIIGNYRYEDIVWGGNKTALDDEGQPLKQS
jgi:thioredoxin reductase